MSQCYHIELKQSVVRVVRAEDSVSYPLELTEILPPEDMRETLRQLLTEAGWEAVGEDHFETEGPAGERLSIDLETMELTATLEVEKEVVAEVKATGQGESNKRARQDARARVDEKAAALGQHLEESGQRELEKETTALLDESEEARQRQLNELLQQVYTEALKRKAGQLGDILEVRESTSESGDYELLIRVAQ